MAPLSLGLNASAKKPGLPSLQSRLAGQKRKKTLFDDGSDGEDGEPSTSTTEDITTLGGLTSQTTTRPNPSSTPHSRDGPSRPKSPKLSNKLTSTSSQPYTNLAALHSSRKHATEAQSLDSSIYDYDGVYDSLHAAKESKSGANGSASSGPKYMKSLLESAETRKRDQLRAKDKLLAKEREAEGDEFADKEKFVTGAYKAQQEELKKIEEEEARREAEEEERKKKGLGGMSGFYKGLLKRDEERHESVVKAVEEAVKGEKIDMDGVDKDESKQKTDAEVAAELNQKGAKIAVNDEGAVVDKRQLLSAGLNVAPKPKTAANAPGAKAVPKPGEFTRSREAVSARQGQRDRQTQMMATQLEDMALKQAEQEEVERKEAEEKAKSRKTQTDVSSAKERYLARKMEREEEAATKKKGAG